MSISLASETTQISFLNYLVEVFRSVIRFLFVDERLADERSVAESVHGENNTSPTVALAQLSTPLLFERTSPILAARSTSPLSHQSEPILDSAHSTPLPTNHAQTQLKQSLPSSKMLLDAYQTMLRARLVDEKTIILYKQNKCHFQIGVAGHEAVQVAVSNTFKAAHDWFYPYYRDMALCSGLGMTDGEFFLNALNKLDDPNSHGRQMPMHYGCKRLNIVNQSSPTGTQYLQAVGCALTSKLKGLDEVTYVSSGEGSCAQGDFHEALNWAAREKLPMVLLVQNNNYAISVHVSEQIAGGSVAKMARGYEGLEVVEVDGTNLLECLPVIEAAYQRARAGHGPTLIEAHVPRLQSHSISDNHQKYRSEEDLASEQNRCPIKKLAEHLISIGAASAETLETMRVTIKREVDEAAEWAEAQPECPANQALAYTFCDDQPWAGVSEPTPSGPISYLVDALNHTLEQELARNPDTYIFGQDVAHGKGGVFTVTSGLTSKFGKERVFNTHLAESSIVGVAVGMATRGLKPIAEIQFGDYIWTAMNQLRNELAMMNYRSGGDFTCPAVIRVPVGGYIHGAPYHSQNIEATFAHFPGLYVIYPSNASDASGLLRSAIRAQDPVLFLEHKGLYRQIYARGNECESDELIPIGKAKVIQNGTDATIITWGALVQKSLLAAKELEKEGISVEIIDLRTIVPFDFETIAQSVAKTNRALIVHEDVTFMGFGAEIAAQLTERCFRELDAPIHRVGMKYAAAVPHAASIEQVVLPQTSDISVALRQLLAF
jgi:2-oxoisovalerate dehydrogenase E1 component